VVAALCARLDGLPLALELAAPWFRLLSPDELLVRLDNRFDVLAGSRRDLPDRQQTMRATVDWSHRLLSELERVFFRRAAAFDGTFDVAAVEEVCGFPPLETREVAAVLAGLNERSMLVVEHGPAGTSRFRLLETLKDFAAERLDESGEAVEVRRRHLEHYLARAERIDRARLEAGSDAQVASLTPDADNLRAALRFGLDYDPPAALRLASALEALWMVRSVGEGRTWLDEALARAPEPTRYRARARSSFLRSSRPAACPGPRHGA
jgi:predicted ATPase